MSEQHTGLDLDAIKRRTADVEAVRDRLRAQGVEPVVTEYDRDRVALIAEVERLRAALLSHEQPQPVAWDSEYTDMAGNAVLAGAGPWRDKITAQEWAHTFASLSPRIFPLYRIPEGEQADK